MAQSLCPANEPLLPEGAENQLCTGTILEARQNFCFVRTPKGRAMAHSDTNIEPMKWKARDFSQGMTVYYSPEDLKRDQRGWYLENWWTETQHQKEQERLDRERQARMEYEQRIARQAAALALHMDAAREFVESVNIGVHVGHRNRQFSREGYSVECTEERVQRVTLDPISGPTIVLEQTWKVGVGMASQEIIVERTVSGWKYTHLCDVHLNRDKQVIGLDLAVAGLYPHQLIPNMEFPATPDAPVCVGTEICQTITAQTPVGPISRYIVLYCNPNVTGKIFAQPWGAFDFSSLRSDIDHDAPPRESQRRSGIVESMDDSGLRIHLFPEQEVITVPWDSVQAMADKKVTVQSWGDIELWGKQVLDNPRNRLTGSVAYFKKRVPQYIALETAVEALERHCRPRLEEARWWVLLEDAQALVKGSVTLEDLVAEEGDYVEGSMWGNNMFGTSDDEGDFISHKVQYRTARNIATGKLIDVRVKPTVPLSYSKGEYTGLPEVKQFGMQSCARADRKAIRKAYMDNILGKGSPPTDKQQETLHGFTDWKRHVQYPYTQEDMDILVAFPEKILPLCAEFVETFALFNFDDVEEIARRLGKKGVTGRVRMFWEDCKKEENKRASRAANTLMERFPLSADEVQRVLSSNDTEILTPLDSVYTQLPFIERLVGEMKHEWQYKERQLLRFSTSPSLQPGRRVSAVAPVSAPPVIPVTTSPESASSVASPAPSSNLPTYPPFTKIEGMNENQRWAEWEINGEEIGKIESDHPALASELAEYLALHQRRQALQAEFAAYESLTKTERQQRFPNGRHKGKIEADWRSNQKAIEVIEQQVDDQAHTLQRSLFLHRRNQELGIE